jgi:hypothetical protein
MSQSVWDQIGGAGKALYDTVSGTVVGGKALSRFQPGWDGTPKTKLVFGSNPYVKVFAEMNNFAAREGKGFPRDAFTFYGTGGYTYLAAQSGKPGVYAIAISTKRHGVPDPISGQSAGQQVGSQTIQYQQPSYSQQPNVIDVGQAPVIVEKPKKEEDEVPFLVKALPAIVIGTITVGVLGVVFFSVRSSK